MEKRFPVSQRAFYGIWVELDNGIECWATIWLKNERYVDGPTFIKAFYPTRKIAEDIIAKEKNGFGFIGFVKAEARPVTLPYPNEED